MGGGKSRTHSSSFFRRIDLCNVFFDHILASSKDKFHSIGQDSSYLFRWLDPQTAFLNFKFLRYVCIWSLLQLINLRLQTKLFTILFFTKMLSSRAASRARITVPCVPTRQVLALQRSQLLRSRSRRSFFTVVEQFQKGLVFHSGCHVARKSLGYVSAFLLSTRFAKVLG